MPFLIDLLLDMVYGAKFFIEEMQWVERAFPFQTLIFFSVQEIAFKKE